MFATLCIAWSTLRDPSGQSNYEVLQKDYCDAKTTGSCLKTAYSVYVSTLQMLSCKR